MKGLLLVAIMAAMLAGCQRVEPESVEQTSNAQAAVDRLFTHDGCTVYRFTDEGRNHYFTKCPTSSSVESQHSETCGKNCWRTVSEEIPTVP